MEVLKNNWKIVIPVIIVFAAAALMESIQVHDDTWYHLLVGRYIYTHQSVPQTGFLVYNHQASPMIYHSWLAQLFFYMVYKVGGLFCLEMIGVFLSVFIGLMFTYLGLKYFSRQAFLLLLSFIMFFTIPFLNIRPNILSLIFFTVLFIVADRCRQKPTVGLFVGIILTLMVWSQVHGFWIYGLVVIALFAVNAYVDGEKEKVYFFTGVLLVSLGLITVLFILIHNRSDFLMDLLYSGVNIRHNEVLEWSSPFSALQRYFGHDYKFSLFLVFKFFFAPFLMAVLIVLSLVYKKRALLDYLLGLVFTVLILYSYRNMMFTVPVFIYITGPVVDGILKEKRKIGAVLIGTSIIIAVVLTGFFVSQKMSDEPMPVDPLPLENLLARLPMTQNLIVCKQYLSDYLLFVLNKDDWHENNYVYSDIRIELFSRKEVRNFYDVLAEKRVLNEVLKIRDRNVIFIVDSETPILGDLLLNDNYVVIGEEDGRFLFVPKRL